jgi:hypothetical protein
VDRTNVEKLSLQKEIEAMLPNTMRDGVGFEPIAIEEIIAMLKLKWGVVKASEILGELSALRALGLAAKRGDKWVSTAE